MAVGTVMLESRDIDRLYRYLRDELEYCVLPGYVNAVYRALVYVDCSNDYTCDSCGLKVCPACSKIQFTVDLDSEGEPAVCMGCDGGIWSKLAVDFGRSLLTSLDRDGPDPRVRKCWERTLERMER